MRSQPKAARGVAVYLPAAASAHPRSSLQRHPDRLDPSPCCSPDRYLPAAAAARSTAPAPARRVPRETHPHRQRRWLLQLHQLSPVATERPSCCCLQPLQSQTIHQKSTYRSQATADCVCSCPQDPAAPGAPLVICTAHLHSSSANDSSLDSGDPQAHSGRSLPEDSESQSQSDPKAIRSDHQPCPKVTTQK